PEPYPLSLHDALPISVEASAHLECCASRPSDREAVRLDLALGLAARVAKGVARDPSAHELAVGCDDVDQIGHDRVHAGTAGDTIPHVVFRCDAVVSRAAGDDVMAGTAAQEVVASAAKEA